MPHMTGHVAETFRYQAKACRSLGSPFTATLCDLLAERLDDSTRFGARILNWPGSARPDALALRAVGALHSLARSGRARELATLYPPTEPAPDALWEAVGAAIPRHDDFLHDFLDSPPQTNEVARSSALLGMMLGVVERFPQPVALFEIGASAGLNLAFDRFHYRLGDDLEWGEANAAVHIESVWQGGLPPRDARLEVVERRGCDRKPLDPGDPEAVERLMAYIWPDQPMRLARISAALSEVASMPFRIEKADAADWVEEQFAAPGKPGITRVLAHTIVWQYLTERTKSRIRAAMERAGAEASAESPLVWLRMEAEGAVSGASLTRTLWPGGETQTIGIADYHGRWVEWNTTES